MRLLFLVAGVLFVAAAAISSEQAEAVLAQVHRAALKADVDTILRHSTEAQRARMKTDVNWREQARVLPHLLPSSYTVTGRAAGATRVVLNLEGSGGHISGKGKSRGKATLLVENGEWRLDKLEWLPYIEPNP